MPIITVTNYQNELKSKYPAYFELFLDYFDEFWNRKFVPLLNQEPPRKIQNLLFDIYCEFAFMEIHYNTHLKSWILALPQLSRRRSSTKFELTQLIEDSISSLFITQEIIFNLIQGKVEEVVKKESELTLLKKKYKKFDHKKYNRETLFIKALEIYKNQKPFEKNKTLALKKAQEEGQYIPQSEFELKFKSIYESFLKKDS